MSEHQTDTAKKLINEIMNPAQPLRGWALYRSGQDAANNLFRNVLQIPQKYGDFLGVEAITSTFLSDQQSLGQVIERYEAKVGEIDADDDRSDSGKKKLRDEVKAAALKEIDALAALPDYQGEIARKNGLIDGAYLGTREKNVAGNSVFLDAVHGREMRDTVERLRQEAKAAGKHEDPVEAMLQEAVETYDASREPFLRAILTPPYPVRVISDELKARTEESLKSKISPELSQKRDYQRDYARVHAELIDAAREAINGRQPGARPRVVTH